MPPLLIQDGSYNGAGSPSLSLPHDWTEGTGIIPAAGISIPNPSTNGQSRKWLLVQNQSAGTISITFQSINSFGAPVTSTLLLSPNSLGLGSQGGAFEMGGLSYHVNSALTITGPGLQALVIEVLE